MIKQITLLLLLLSSTVYSQSISPLIPYLTNNQLLSRPKVLRDLQAEMTKNGENGKGLKIDDLSKYFTNLKTSIKELKVFQIDTNDNSIKISSSFLKETIKVKEDELIIDNNITFTHTIQRSFNDSLNRYLGSIISKFDPSVQAIIINGLLIVFSSDNSGYSVDLNDIKKDAILKNISLLAGSMTKYIFDYLENYKISDINITKQKDTISLQTVVRIADFLFNEIDSKIKDKIITKIKSIQDYLENDLKDISNWLLSGNMGLGISKSEGEFTGGIQISYNLSTTFQTGIFINNNFKDQSDSLNVKPASLIGFQGRFATENIQADALFSGYFGNTNFKAFKDFEFGIGVSGKLSSLIVGASFYNLISFADGTNYSKVQNLGLYVKTSSRQSPTLYFGIIRDKDGWGNLAVKIIYPINAL